MNSRYRLLALVLAAAIAGVWVPPVAAARNATGFRYASGGTQGYAGTVLNDGPYGYWRLGEAAGAIANDSSGHTRTGTYTNAPTLAQTGPLGAAPSGVAASAALFTAASSQYVALGAAPIVGGTNLANDFTVEAWFKTSTANTVVYGEGHDSGGGPALWEIQVQAAATGIQFVSRNDAGSGGTIVTYNEGVSAPNRADGAWHHAVFVRSGSAWFIYVDGVQTATGVWAVSGVFTLTAAAIGVRPVTTKSLYFNGTLAEVAVYPFALGGARDIVHYNAGLNQVTAADRWPARVAAAKRGVLLSLRTSP